MCNWTGWDSPRPFQILQAFVLRPMAERLLNNSSQISVFIKMPTILCLSILNIYRPSFLRSWRFHNPFTVMQEYSEGSIGTEYVGGGRFPAEVTT